jgi:hypothetical protein
MNGLNDVGARSFISSNDFFAVLAPKLLSSSSFCALFHPPFRRRRRAKSIPTPLTYATRLAKRMWWSSSLPLPACVYDIEGGKSRTLIFPHSCSRASLFYSQRRGKSHLASTTMIKLDVDVAVDARFKRKREEART